MNSKKVTVEWDGRGGVLVTARKAAARFFVTQTDEGGLYIEIAKEGGRSITANKTSRDSTSAIVQVTGGDDAAE